MNSAETGSTPESIFFPGPLTVTIKFPNNLPEGYRFTHSALTEPCGLGQHPVNDFLHQMTTEYSTNSPPSPEDFRELWCPWDEDLTEGHSIFWAFTDRKAFEEVKQALHARNQEVNFCAEDTSADDTAQTSLTVFLVNSCELIDLIGRIYNHCAGLEQHLFKLRQELSETRELLNRVLESAARQDPTLAPLCPNQDRRSTYS